MFVPKAAAPGARNTRRRQRTSSDDSVKPPKAKRQRSVLRQKDDSPSDAQLSGLPLSGDVTTDPMETEFHLPLRGSKQTEALKNDKEDYYTVEQLPALPDQIRGLQSEPLRCFFGPGHDHALALTRSHAIVWPYSAPTSSPSSSETFTVSIPESCRDLNGPVPLGILLSTVTGGHPGLLVLIPSTGKIIYWETVSSIASLGLSRQKQNGIQGSISGLLSGEHAIEVMNGEPSGIIATFSSGRVAHITVRDSQGKPSVLVNFLRSTVGAGGGGFLDGIKNVLGGGSWRKEVTAVRTGGSHQRGQRDVVIVTSAGLLEIWDTHWNHGNALKKRYDAKDDITAAIAQNHVNTSGEPDLKVMDFAFPAQQQAFDENTSPVSEESWRLFLVVGSPQWLESKRLFLVQICLSGSECRILSTHPVDLHSVSAGLNELKPKIFVPRSEGSAFILLGQSLVMLSLASVEETPSSQLLLDSNKSPLSLQDMIHLRSGKDYEILGCGPEDEPSGNSYGACVLMVRNFGVLRVTVFPRDQVEGDAEEAQATAKHKLEQAIFFGTMAKNPLNLAGESGFDFPPAEIEQAALEICHETMRSDSKFIPRTAISVEQNLRLRAKALDDLISLLCRKGNPLSRPARWELLWAAEKIAAQKAMWKVGESYRGEGEKPFLNTVIESMNDRFKTRLDPQQGENDPVRQWFLKDSFQMEHIIPWIMKAIKPRRGNSSKQARKLSEQILEASEISLAIMETAFRYRDEHAGLYGLGEDFLEDGVLADGYEDLPEFWTSKAVGYTETGHLLDWELDSCRAWIQQRTSSADAPDAQVLKNIAENSARHLRVLGQMHRERFRWLAVQEDPQLVDESASIEQTHIKERKWQLFKLAGIGHLQDALSLAERFRDMEALVELVIELQDQMKNQGSSADVTPIGDREGVVEQRISQYFETFGEPWAGAYFSRQISMGHPGALLSMKKYQPFVTRFLRKSSAYLRLSWINDVVGEDDYDTAAASLEQLALSGETNLWSHQVEISLAKLGRLASWERSQPQDLHPASREAIQRLDDHTAIDVIQQDLYNYIQPVFEGAIDKKAEVELALDYFGSYLSEDRPSLHEILNEALTTMINRQVVGADDLLDLLTLIGPAQTSEDKDSETHHEVFFQALQVLERGRYVQQNVSYESALRKLIWRRCMIRDDWEARGKAAEEVNGNSDLSATETALHYTLGLCLGEWYRDVGGRVSLTLSTENRELTHPSLYQPLSPAEALMSESESEVLVSRFRPEQRARIALDLQREDDLLRQYIEAGKLDFWYQNLLASADARSSASRATDATSGDARARLTWV
ncbi:uncharacterized protein PFLUO_LOCUS8431 [Penicillium psychrofluorescens]|uniref:uncharacterized protein n=1 Tax=Penicillium psychrofluorescens TaxID=3158075 RepID=UPI003CCD9746